MTFRLTALPFVKYEIVGGGSWRCDIKPLFEFGSSHIWWWFRQRHGGPLGESLCADCSSPASAGLLLLADAVVAEEKEDPAPFDKARRL